MGEPDEALDATLVGTGDAHTTMPRSSLAVSMRSTVLPRPAQAGESGREEASRSEPRFVPVRLLGEGGLGEVTLVRDNDIERPVALKRLRDGAQGDELLFRFVQEIRTVGQLEHPNIAPIHDVGIDDQGRHYFVMRYVEGETLEQVIAKLAAGDPDYHRRFTFERRVQLFLGVLHAIEYAHSKQILHRDLKPANIMVGPFGEVVVMDWGIAKKKTARDEPPCPEAAAAAPAGARDELYRTRHGTLVGTPAYMSPEQAAGRTGEIDERSDIYSLCVVFYELLALQHYLPGRTNTHEMLIAVCEEEHRMISHVRSPHQPNVPQELAWFLERGLAKEPGKRYASVAEMIDELQRVISGGFEVQCVITAMKRGGEGALRFVDAHPYVAALSALALLAVTAVGVLDVVLRLVRG